MRAWAGFSYTDGMEQPFIRPRLDVLSFARAADRLSGELTQRDALQSQFVRLWSEACDTQELGAVAWLAEGELCKNEAGDAQPWIHIDAQAALPLVCQRCLQPVTTTISVQRSFRFVADEATAALEDDQSEEDVLVWDAAFDVLELVEDELLMAMPLLPMHDECPVAVITSVSDAEFDRVEAERLNPFAALASLRTPDA